jgi:GAF domain-containing protein
MAENISSSGYGEIGSIQAGIVSLINGLQIKSAFASEIGKGNYNKEFEPLSEHDTIGSALLNMRNNLKKSAEEEGKRNWATAGLAQIGELLRQPYASSQQLHDQVLTFLVKYLNANQGGLFLLQDETNNVQLELVSCYAYNRKKYQHKMLAAGEGLVGQAFLEKDTIVLTQIPQDYLHITSGLGQANPRFLLIVPLRINEAVHGVVELASFQVFEKYQIEFVERIAESIASTISTVKTNEITRKLLDETQTQTEQMRAQEEEVRQNMEELMATQENQIRLQEELKANEKIMKENLQELQQAKVQLEKKEAELIQANEKSQARANKFRDKLEAIDGEMENKTSQINVLKKANEELLEKLSKYENQSI